MCCYVRFVCANESKKRCPSQRTKRTSAATGRPPSKKKKKKRNAHIYLTDVGRGLEAERRAGSQTRGSEARRARGPKNLDDRRGAERQKGGGLEARRELETRTEARKLKNPRRCRLSLQGSRRALQRRRPRRRACSHWIWLFLCLLCCSTCQVPQCIR